jgi:GntR family transcriptional regulator
MATMWRDIADDLRRKIEAGELGSDGRALPTESELQKTYDASRNTVREAMRWLSTRGLVEKSSGRGTFVREKLEPFVTTFSSAREAGLAETAAFEVAVRNRSRTPQVSRPRVELREAGEFPGPELQLPAGASMISRHQERRIDDVPYSLQTTFYPMSLADRGATRLRHAVDIEEGAVGYIQDELGIIQAGWRDQITVRVPDLNEARFFGLPDDGSIAVVQVVRVGFDAAGTPFRVTVTTYPADRNVFEMETGQVPENPVGAAAAKSESTERNR